MTTETSETRAPLNLIEPRFHLCGASALLLDLAGEKFDLTVQQRLWSLCAAHGALQQLNGVRDLMLGVNNVTVGFDPLVVAVGDLQAALLRCWEDSEPSTDPGKLVEIPVHYETGAEFDLLALAERAALSVEEVFALHVEPIYRVACMGWVPGFAFLLGLPEALVTPRRATPRLRVPPGAVGIGGAQTGAIPIAVPSGWNLIGRTKLALFDPQRSPPCLLRAGDRVRFVPEG